MGLTVLTAGSRLTDPEGFRAASRRGRRAGSRSVVTHLLPPEGTQVVGVSGAGSARVGFVVSKAVGTAVVRNQVKRRLRHAMRDRLDALPAGSLLVVRAQAPAATASYPELVADLDRCLQRVVPSDAMAGEA
ncbi:ribonuclease P protein component [Nocardioides sp. CPCC 206347]